MTDLFLFFFSENEFIIDVGRTNYAVCSLVTLQSFDLNWKLQKLEGNIKK